MKKNRWALRAAALLLISGLSLVTFSAAAEAGSSGDPLVTLSYLQETYLPALLARVDERIAGSPAGPSAGADTFAVVTLSAGQTLTGGIGCEVMLRVGSAACAAPSAPGLVDETSGGTVNDGAALEKNHLYMMTIEGRGVRAVSDTVKVLARGGYSVA